MHVGNKDGSIVQPLLILNEDNGQQLYKGNTSHWKVWQSLIEEGDQLDDRDDVFRQVACSVPFQWTSECLIFEKDPFLIWRALGGARHLVRAIH